MEKKSLDGLVFTDEKIVGKWMTVEEVLTEIEKETVFFDESKGGVTFSGGEPLAQFDFLMELLKACKERDIHTTLDTTGYCREDKFNKLPGQVDLFLYDLKMMNDAKHKQYTGISNRLILKNLKTLSDAGERVILRFPVVPGINDTEENISELKLFMRSLSPTIREISLLPYHNLGKNKYERFNIQDKMNGVKAMERKDLHPLKKDFEEIGFEVRIGG